MEAMDLIMQQAFPLIAAPIGGVLQEAEKSGTRYIAAKDGLWREVSLPWIRVVHKIAESSCVLPYGGLVELVDVRCSAIPVALRKEFLAHAMLAMPNEMAAAVIWNQSSDTWRYEARECTDVSQDHVVFNEVRLLEGEHLVLDLHSHGHHEAFFSTEDDHDDAGSMKFSGVVGSLSSGTPTSVMRLNMAGMIWDATLSAGGNLEVFTR